MLPSPQVLHEKQKRPTAVGGLPPGDVAVRPLGAARELHDDPVAKGRADAEAAHASAAAAKRERDAKRAAERAELHRAIAAGREQAKRPGRGGHADEPEVAE